jgi:hypothetical protein
VHLKISTARRALEEEEIEHLKNAINLYVDKMMHFKLFEEVARNACEIEK